jgi:hypothetical protein
MQSQKLWDEVEWDWYRRTKRFRFFCIGIGRPIKRGVIDHRLIGWNETMITYFLAIASKNSSDTTIYVLYGLGQPISNSSEVSCRLGDKLPMGATYTNGNTYYGIELPVGVSNGGPIVFLCIILFWD